MLAISDVYDIDEVIRRQRRRFCVPVEQPLVLISQIQRSGGTLICQLLDGHSQLHVHPGELHIGRPRKYDWPALDMARPPGELFDALFERPLLEYTQDGYQKVSSAEAQVDPLYRQRVLPFMFHVRLQKELFLERAAAAPMVSQRQTLNGYVTSYFNAWLDYQGLYREPARVRYWVSFGARTLARPGNFHRFHADYPDGRAIAVLRDPVSWYASARRHSHEYEDAEQAMRLWLQSYQVIRDNVAAYPEHTLVVKFEDCVSNLRAAMARIAHFLGIGFEPSLLEPTFNGMRIQSDSSFGSKFGVDASVVDRSDLVEPSARDYIRSVTRTLYAELSDHAAEQARRYDAP